MTQMVVHEALNNRVLSGWIQDRFGYDSVDKWVEEVVKNMLCDTNQKELPVMLAPFCELRRIDISRIDPKQVTNERRFTIAHEVAHSFMFDISKNPPRNVFPPVPKHVAESFCNKLAAEILMPRDWAISHVKHYCQTSIKVFPIIELGSLLIDIHKQFKVSHSVLGRRLIEDMGLWNMLLLGVRWSGTYIRGQSEILGQLEIGKSGFTIRLHSKNPRQLDPEHKTKWRIHWYAKPSGLGTRLYIPRGYPSVQLLSIEKLLRPLKTTRHVVVNEPVKNLRIGNIATFLRNTFGTQDKYLTYAYRLGSLPTRKSTLYSNDNTETSYDKVQLLVCIPLGKDMISNRSLEENGK